MQLPRSLRQLFASLLIYNNVTNPGRLWDRHKGALIEDFLHQAHQVSAQKASTKEVYIASLPFVDFNVTKNLSLSIILHISYHILDNCALLDYNPPAPDCIAQVTPNRQLDHAILDQGLREVEQLLHAQGGKTLEDFELPILAQLPALGDVAISEERARYNVT